MPRCRRGSHFSFCAFVPALDDGDDDEVGAGRDRDAEVDAAVGEAFEGRAALGERGQGEEAGGAEGVPGGDVEGAVGVAGGDAVAEDAGADVDEAGANGIDVGFAHGVRPSARRVFTVRSMASISCSTSRAVLATVGVARSTPLSRGTSGYPCSVT